VTGSGVPSLGANVYKTDSLDLTLAANANAWKLISKAVHSGALSALPISVAETMKAGTESVDAVQLVLTYYPPALRAQTTSDIASNCLPSCTWWLTGSGSSFKGSFYVQGSTFVPNGAFDFGLGNQTLGDAFRYGLVAWGINVKMLNKYPSATPVVSIPDDTPGFGSDVTIVDLKVYVCPGQSTCTASGSVALTARVKIKDASTPAPKQRQINILSWAAQR